jgi:hypothetical protein
MWQSKREISRECNDIFTFYVDVFFPLSLTRLLLDLNVYMSNTRVFYKKQDQLTLREYLSSRFFGGVRIGHLFSF